MVYSEEMRRKLVNVFISSWCRLIGVIALYLILLLPCQYCRVLMRWLIGKKIQQSKERERKGERKGEVISFNRLGKSVESEWSKKQFYQLEEKLEQVFVFVFDTQQTVINTHVS